MNLRTITDKIVEGIKLIMVQPTVFFTIKIQDAVEGTDYTTKIVKPFYSGRPDLIALDEYGDSSMADIILKFNGISDPFSIIEGEVIKIPRKDFPFKKLNRISEQEENIVKQQFIKSKRMSKKDARRVEAMKQKYDKDSLLPPNVIAQDNKTFKFQAGAIIFGAQAQNDPVVDEIMKGKNGSSNKNSQGR